MMSMWILTVWLTYKGVDQLWLEQTFSSEDECRQWQAFYSEYPFRPQCTELKQIKQL